MGEKKEERKDEEHEVIVEHNGIKWKGTILQSHTMCNI